MNSCLDRLVRFLFLSFVYIYISLSPFSCEYLAYLFDTNHSFGKLEIVVVEGSSVRCDTIRLR